jgi:hypothetical protein
MGDDYAALWRLDPDARRDWIARTYPQGCGIQWWLSIVDSAESQARSRLRRGEPARAVFEFATSLLALGAADGTVDPVRHGYWLLRLSASAREFAVPEGEMPAEITPDIAARRALDAMPVGAADAVDIGRRLDQDFRAGIDRPPDAESRAVGDVAFLVHALAWVRDAVTDPDLQRDIDLWRRLMRRATWT